MRDMYLLSPDTVFLNHGSFGACPRPVFDAWQAWQLEVERNPVLYFSRRSAALLADARAQLGAFVGASGSDLVFLPNATTGVSTVLHSLAASLPLRPGDEVVTTDHEYGACDMALQRVCDAAGALVRRVAIPLPYDAASWAQRVLDAVTPRTRLVFVSHMTSVTALIFPVAELCAEARQRGITTLIDGAHASGHMPLDLHAIGADFYTGNCHKWLSAPKSAAFLHARPERQAELEAPVVSWGYVANDIDAHGPTAFDSYTGRTPFERRLQWQGTHHIAAWLAVPAAIDFQQRHDWPRWQQRCHDLACDTQQRVLARNGLAAVAPDAAFGQMVTIPVRVAADGEAPAALQRWLFSEHRIEVPVMQHGGHSFVRVSVQPYNERADLDALVGALKDAGV